MGETFEKIDENTVKVTAQTETVINKTLTELKKDLTQAEESLVMVTARHADEEVAIQKTIELFQARLAEAEKLGVTEADI